MPFDLEILDDLIAKKLAAPMVQPPTTWDAGIQSPTGRPMPMESPNTPHVPYQAPAPVPTPAPTRAGKFDLDMLDSMIEKKNGQNAIELQSAARQAIQDPTLPAEQPGPDVNIGPPTDYRSAGDEFLNALKLGTYKTGGGIAGTVAKFAELADKPGLNWVGDKARLVAEDAKRAMTVPEWQPQQDPKGKKWLANVVGQTLPFMATAALATVTTGTPLAAFGVGFAVEGDDAYDAAIGQGASEGQANMERVVVGTLNGAIEFMQMGGIFKFAKTGKASTKAIIAAAKQKSLAKIAKEGGRLGMKAVETAVTEGIEEALQEAVSMTAPALGGRDIPTAGEYIARTKEAAAGGAAAGLILGAGGSLISPGQRAVSPDVVTKTTDTAKPIPTAAEFMGADAPLDTEIAPDTAEAAIQRMEAGKAKDARRRGPGGILEQQAPVEQQGMAPPSALDPTVRPLPDVPVVPSKQATTAKQAGEKPSGLNTSIHGITVATKEEQSKLDGLEDRIVQLRDSETGEVSKENRSEFARIRKEIDALKSTLRQETEEETDARIMSLSKEDWISDLTQDANAFNDKDGHFLQKWMRNRGYSESQIDAVIDAGTNANVAGRRRAGEALQSQPTTAQQRPVTAPQSPPKAVTPVEPASAGVEVAEPQRAIKQPWEMTKAEWENEFEQTRPSSSGAHDVSKPYSLHRITSEKSAGKLIDAAQQRQEFLKMGLKDARPYADDADPDLKYIQIPARHWRVIEHALEQGKPVPAEVLKDYPDLQSPPKQAPKAKQAVEGKGDYVYHGTSEGAFRKIRQEGMKGKTLYFADTEQYAQSYADRKGASDRLVRVKKTADIIPDDQTTGGDFKTSRQIDPQDIEIKVGNKWVPIQEYSDEARNIMPLAPKQAVEKVEKKAPPKAAVKPKPAKVEKAITPKATPVGKDITLTVEDLPDMAAWKKAGLGVKERPGGKKDAVTWLKAFIREEPEFAQNPSFRVDDDKNLVFQDGVKYRLKPKLFGLDPESLRGGQEITIDIASLGYYYDTHRNKAVAIQKAKKTKRIVSQKAKDDATKRLSDPNRLRSMLSPQDLIDMVTVGAYHFENGVRTFAEWSKVMIDAYGTRVKPALKKTWQQVRKDVPKATPVAEVAQEAKPEAKKAAEAPSKPTTTPSKPVEAPSTLQKTPLFQKGLEAIMKELGITSLNSKDRQNWADDIQKAKDENFDARRVTDEILEKPRTLESWEVAGLGVKAVELRTELNGLMDKVATAKDAELADLGTKASRVEKEIGMVMNAIHLSGTPTARALSIRRMLLAEDFSTEAVKGRVRAAKGEELTPKQEKTIERLTREVEVLNAKLRKAEARMKTTRVIKHVRQGRKRYAGMSQTAKNTELTTLANKANELLAAGC